MGEIPLDVFLRGERNYVQGTQLVARIADAIAPSSAFLVEAEFHRLTENCVVARGVQDTSEPQNAPIGRVAFSVNGRPLEFRLEETPRPAPRLDRAMPIRFVRHDPSTYESASYAYEGAGDLESGLNVIVQATKDSHELYRGGATDIWLTGLRRCAFPADWPSAFGKGTVSVERLRTMAGDGGARRQTMSRVTMSAADAPQPLTGFVTFAFRERAG